jgi:predicted O-linked N-acetylglucosamine transferase (SPINDLY family)
MGVPVLTLAGSSFLSRQGAGILINSGLAEWVAGSTDDYIALALSHAQDLQRLTTLRSELRQQVLTSPIMNSQRFAQNFAVAFTKIWQAQRNNCTNK